LHSGQATGDTVPVSASQGRRLVGGVAASTIAKIPAFTTSGRVSQRSTTSAKPADFLAKSAKQDAKSISPVAEVLAST